ncbi:MAG TPA: bifunctional adenosylcobinamide kinase/adenosylcobinamide-phosphate guanylyltransferase [Symbiobacteriaceae bacterium]|jgi:adenosylcobinamide kinase/adenosylcobinamide-phosphate guanylyltransferase
MLVLILGGARSGKSEAAERLAPKLGGRVVYLAPGQAWDAEMTERIRRHQARRDRAWATVEEPVDIPGAVRRHGAQGVCLLLDGLGTWVSNLLLAELDEAQILARVADFLAALRETGAAAVVVSDEAGLGVVPPSPLGRLFRDCLGRANQQLAAAADRALLVVAGIPVDLKALEVTL